MKIELRVIKNLGNKFLSELSFDLYCNYLDSVNEIINKETLELVPLSVKKGTPYGKDGWLKNMVAEHGLIHTTRGRGRPKINHDTDYSFLLSLSPFF